jgi:hypothetical protein
MNPLFVVWAMRQGPLKTYKSKMVNMDLIVVLDSRPL